MNKNKNKNLPIGYWLKKADELLTEGIDKIQSSYSLSRLDWQILNAIKKMDISSQDEIIETLQPFSNAAGIISEIKELSQRGFIRKIPKEKYELTQSGLDLYKKALTKQKEFRERVSNGITKEDYSITMSVLKKLVNNLENESAV